MAYASPSGNLLDKHMREGIRTFLWQTVLKEPGSMYIDEYCFNVGTKSGRCDIVVVNNLLHCYEIKSDGDSNGLQRLSKIQIKLYGQVMDRLSVVVTPKYLSGVRKMLPAFWGIYSFVDGMPQEMRAPAPNHRPEPRALAGLLWRDYSLQLLADAMIGGGYSKKNKSYLHDLIAEQVAYDQIHEAVRRQLKSHRRSL